MSLPDFEAPEFDADEWAAGFGDSASIGAALEELFDRPSTTTMEHGSEYTTLVFVGQELDAVRALVGRLREVQ